MLRRSASVLALCGALICAATSVADEKKSDKAASFGALQIMPVDQAKAKAADWFKASGKTDAASQAAFENIWKTDASVLEKVAETLALGDAKAKTLLDEARDVTRAAPTEVPSILKDTKQPSFYRANLALAYAKALSSRRVYEEALDALNSVKVEQVVDPAAFLFNKAVAEHALLKGPQASATILRLLDDVPDAPERYKMVASMMVFDILQWKDKDLGDIARKMDNIERRLDLTRGGPQTQKMQREVLLKLEEMIKEKENQQKGGGGGGGNGGQCPDGSGDGPGQSGKNPNNTTKPSAPQDDSYGGNGSGPGNVDPKKLKEMAEGWGKLPERERAKAMIELTRDMPPRYRQVIQKYFEELSKQTENGNK